MLRKGTGEDSSVAPGAWGSRFLSDGPVGDEHEERARKQRGEGERRRDISGRDRPQVAGKKKHKRPNQKNRRRSQSGGGKSKKASGITQSSGENQGGDHRGKGVGRLGGEGSRRAPVVSALGTPRKFGERKMTKEKRTKQISIHWTATANEVKFFGHE